MWANAVPSGPGKPDRFDPESRFDPLDAQAQYAGEKDSIAGRARNADSLTLVTSSTRAATSSTVRALSPRSTRSAVRS